jgi:hypothetical protein
VVSVVEYEVRADGRASGITAANLRFYIDTVPELFSPLAWLAIGGGAIAAWALRRHRVGQVWLFWAGSVAFVKIFIATSDETRHAILFVPPLVGFTTCLFHPSLPRRVTRIVAPCAMALLLAGNVPGLARLPEGIRGYEAVADVLARAPRPGNVLVACWMDQDLMFRYRAAAPSSSRYMLRADRTLAIRLAQYAEVEPTRIARTIDDVIGVVRRGRVRYVVTVDAANDMGEALMTDEMRLARRAVRETDAFREIARLPLHIGFRHRDNARGEVAVWEYAGDLPPGPHDLPLVIPTIGLGNRPARR